MAVMHGGPQQPYQQEFLWAVLSITASRKITKDELDSCSPGDFDAKEFLKMMGQCKQREQISAIAKTKSSRTILSSIKVYLAESGGALPFKFMRLLKTIGPKLAINKLNADTIEHQHIMLFVTQLTDRQATLLWSVLSCLHGIAANSAGAISSYDLARSFVTCMMSEQVPDPNASEWAYITVRYLIDNVESLMPHSEGQNQCHAVHETKKQTGAPVATSTASAITPAEIAQCKAKQQRMAAEMKFLEAQRLKELVTLLQQPIYATLPKLQQQLQSFQEFKKVLRQNSIQWLQELALVTKQIGVLKESIASLNKSTNVCPVYPNTNVTAAAATPYPAYIPVSAADAPVSQSNPTPSAPYNVTYPTKMAPATSSSPLVANNTPSVANQYPAPSTSSTTTVTTTMPARGIPRGPATLHTGATTQLHKMDTNGVLPPINPSANAPVYPSGGASVGPYPTQTPVQASDSSAIIWKCQLCNTSNTSNVCSGCAIPRPAAQNTAPISPTPPQATPRMAWMFAAVGTEIFCPYALSIQALLEQQFWKTKSLPAVTLHTLQLGPDSVYEIKRQQNLLFQVNKQYGTQRAIFRVAGTQQSVGQVLINDNQQLAVVCGFTLQKNPADTTAATVSMLCVRALAHPFAKYTIPAYTAKSSPVQMSVGVGVVRGPDWPPACHVDGGGPGRVTSIQSDGNVVVKWDKSPASYKHRWGLRSCFDLALIFPASGAPAYPTYPVHPGMASRGIAPQARPPFITPRPRGMGPRPRPTFEMTYPRPFNNPRGPVYPRPRPNYPRQQLPPGPRPSLHAVNAVPRGLHRCVGGHNLQAFFPPAATFYCNACMKPLQLGLVAFGCRLCNFDVCKTCDEKPLPLASWGFIEGSNFIPYQIDQSLIVEAGYERFTASGGNPSCNSVTIVGGGKRYKICFQPDPRTAPPGARYEQVNESSGYKRPVERREVMWGFIESNIFKPYPIQSASMVECAYQRFKHRGAMNTLSITSGGRQYLLTFDETKGHQQTNSATGTSRTLKRTLKAPKPVPAPTPAPAPAPAPTQHVAAPAPAPFTGTTPSSLYDAIQLSFHSAQWGFYSDAGKYVPFKPDQSKAVETAFGAKRNHHDITAGSNTYRIHFSKNAKGNYWQENLSSHYKRDVARIHGGVSSYKASSSHNNTAKKPPAPAPAPAPSPAAPSVGQKLDQFRKTWTSSGLDSKKTKSVSKGSTEWGKVTSVFRKTLSKSVSRIERIENKLQWDGFVIEKAKIQADCGPDWNESTMLHELFHGTDVNALSSIVGGLDGFLPLLAGTKVGAIYGNGTYFARDAKYSDDYAARLGNGSRQMLLCFVIVGKRHVGKAGDKMYPLLPGSSVKRYHCLCNKTSGTSIFVVQKGSQAYPAYLITYK